MCVFDPRYLLVS
jgi:hypothetical protein